MKCVLSPGLLWPFSIHARLHPVVGILPFPGDLFLGCSSSSFCGGPRTLDRALAILFCFQGGCKMDVVNYDFSKNCQCCLGDIRSVIFLIACNWDLWSVNTKNSLPSKQYINCLITLCTQCSVLGWKRNTFFGQCLTVSNKKQVIATSLWLTAPRPPPMWYPLHLLLLLLICFALDGATLLQLCMFGNGYLLGLVMSLILW